MNRSIPLALVAVVALLLGYCLRPTAQAQDLGSILLNAPRVVDVELTQHTNLPQIQTAYRFWSNGDVEVASWRVNLSTLDNCADAWNPSAICDLAPWAIVPELSE